MKLRWLQTALLYGGLFLVLFLLLRTCVPEPAPPPEVGLRAAVEAFDSAGAPVERTVDLRTDVLWTVWSARGAGCRTVRLARRDEFHNTAGREAGSDGWMTLYEAVPAYPPPAGQEPGPEHHRRRDALQIFEPEGLLGADLRAVDWEVRGPEAQPDGGQELSFTTLTPAGVRLTRIVRARPGALHLEVETRAEAVADDLTGRDLALRIGTGGGILREQDAFYPNPYVGAAVLEHGSIGDVKTLHPRGPLPPVRAAAARWNGDAPFVAEGSKYFLSAIRALDGSFQGATAEVLFDAEHYERAVLEGLAPAEAERVQRVAAADAEMLRAAGRPATGPELAERAGLPETEALAVRARYYDRAREARESSWLRASVAGHFRLHLGRPGDAPATSRVLWYVGPKDPAVLSTPEYEELRAVIRHVDYGSSLFYRLFLTHFVAQAILAVMQVFHWIVGNWGVAIVLLTLLVRALLFPVSRHSQVRMAHYQARVAALKPQLDAVRQKYANNPQRQSEETFKLYREHKIAPPVGGCLPILLQFPVFIGLFAALRCSILLREEPFLLWVQDLSRPDALLQFGGPVLDFWPLRSVVSLNVLPILMVVLWVWQQRSMPKPVDPQQAQMQKIMVFMPLLFGLMLYNYAAGLSLYMITSSALGIVESRWIRKRWPLPAGAPAAPGR